MQIASLKKRIISFIIDEIFIDFIFIFTYFQEFSKAQTPLQMQMFFSNNLLEFILMQIIYQAFFIYMYGKTLGKYLTKTKCVDYEFNKPNLVASLKRSLLRIISEFFCIGFMFAFFTKKRQTFHDLISKTLVVDDKN